MAAIAFAAILTPAHAQAAAPTAPPTVLVAPSGTVTEETILTFRIQANAEDHDSGHWGVYIEAGNEEIIELEPASADPSVYERSIRLHNGRVFAAHNVGKPPDFHAPRISSRIFPGEVTWRVAFYPASKPSEQGDAKTRTAKQTFTFAPTFQRRQKVDDPGLPAAKSRRLVPNKSFAGVSLGDRRSRVLKLWSSPFVSDETLFDRTDTYARGSVIDGDPQTRGDVMIVEYDQDNVGLIQLFRPRTNPGGLEKYKTSKGVGLGSTRRRLLRAHPNIQQLDDDEEDGTEGFVLPGKGLRETVFGLDRKHRVNTILMR